MFPFNEFFDLSRFHKHSGKITVIFVLFTIFLFGQVAKAKYGGGSGEPNDPYLIYTAEQMNTIGTEPNDWDKHFKLMADIDLSAYNGTDFNIIGYWAAWNDRKPFTGLFDGNGKTISNFTYISSDTANNGDYQYVDKADVGLFGYAYRAKIEDLRIVEPSVSAEKISHVGALAGRFYDGTISCCAVEGGRIAGEYYVGGLIGGFSGDIFECHSSSTVIAKSEGGGLIGENSGNTSLCYSTANVEGDNTLGGLVGQNWNGTISQCHSNSIVSGRAAIGGLVGDNDKRIDSCYCVGSVSGNITVGGLCGNNGGSITSCNSAASVTGLEEDAGGLIGYNSGTVKSCWACGNIQAEQITGGLVGSNIGTIMYCYATGIIQGDSRIAGLVASNGGTVLFSYSTGRVLGNKYVAGFTRGGSTHLCYWDIETSGVSESAGGKGKTTAQMKSASTYRGWGYESQWVIDDRNDYPHLVWEEKPGQLIVDPLRTYGGGTGEPNDPYQIWTAEQLVCLGYYREDFDKHFILTGNIDLSAIDVNETMPIGTNGAPFTGSFVGNQHTISNFKCLTNIQDYIGLFGYIGHDGHISNVNLVDVAVSGARYIGGLVGYNLGTIQRCSITGTIEGNDNTGGLVGYSGGSITECSITGEVIGNNHVGGLVGYNYKDILACCSASSVTGNNNVGGLVGTNGRPMLWTIHPAPPLGYMPAPAECPISSCYFAGSVEGQEQVGGLVGENAGFVITCYSAGSVIDTSSPYDSNRTMRTVDRSDASTTTDRPTVCGLIGNNNYGVVTLSYWDTEVSGQIASASGRGKTTEQMMIAQTFRGWGYSGEWVIDEGNDYPRLAWEGLGGEFIIDTPDRYSSGTGEPNDPYRICTADEFITLANYPIDWNKYFVLTSDIDFNDVDPNLILPIGTYGLPFVGLFNGNGYTISNFKLLSETESYLGVFGRIGSEVSYYPWDPTPQKANGLVINLNLENVEVSAYCCAGGLAGFNGGIISNCSVTGCVTAALKNAGGLAGYNLGEVTQCSTHCDVTTQGVTGGLIGYNLGPVTHCSCSGNVKTEGTYNTCAGGLIGESYGEVELCRFSGNVGGGYNVGGLVGLNEGTVLNCSAAGDVTGLRYYTGGLVGKNEYGRSISRSFSASNVTGETSIGGLVGLNEGEILNCYATGSVDGINYVGGLAGENHEIIAFCYSACTVAGQQSIAGLLGNSRWGDITSCFWDSDVSGLTDGVADQDPDPEDILGLSTTQMQISTTFTNAGWDFVGETENGEEDIWWILEGQDYPRLWWEAAEP